ncbi:MAG: thioredoxin family protein, partial [Ignavibacteria bacterium]|nr:thioredoxin family protein [Ignavibacteria bacterium]
LLIVLYILGIFRLPHDSPVEKVGTPRIVISIFFASIGFFLFAGLTGKPLGELDAFLPPPNYYELMSASAGDPNSNPEQFELKDDGKENKDFWHNNYENALSEAKEKNIALFVDFTGFTCTNCRWMELNMFSKPEVQSLLKQMVKVKLYTDRREEPYVSNKKMQQERFNSIELPLYVILTPNEEFVATKAFTRDEREFLDFLKKGRLR